MTSRARTADAVFALSVLAIACVVWWEARKLPPAPFDPLGPGSVPELLSYLLGLLGLVLLGRVALRLRVGEAAQSLILGIGGPAPTDYRLRPDLALGSFALLVLYAAALEVPGVGFLPASVVFLAALGALLAPRSRAGLITALAVAVVAGIAIELLFRRVFFVDLP